MILVIQENRTPDNLFLSLLTYPGINPVRYDLASSGLALVNGEDQVIPLTPRSLSTDYDLEHSHDAFMDMWNKGKMDGANLVPDNCNRDAVDCQNGGQGQFLSYKYVQASDIDPYLQLASQYGWANYMFQTNQGPSFVAHQILFAGTSARTEEDDANGVFVEGNPGQPKGDQYYGMRDSGCLAPLGEVNAFISPESAPDTYLFLNDPIGSFCFDHDSMADLLDAGQLSWKYYVVGQTGNPYPNDPTMQGYNPAGFMFSAPSSIYNICLPDYSQEVPVCTSPEFVTNIDLNPHDILSDIAHCNLASEAWVTPTANEADHAGSKKDIGGPSWVAAIVNAVGNDKTCEQGAGYWSDTVILVTWDDWGGWYDHVPPPILPGPQGDYELGFRVPLLVISAYTQPGYVSNFRHDFGSIVRFMQGIFGIPEGSLGFSDARTTDDLSNFFNFNIAPRPFQTIQAKWGAKHFLDEAVSPEPPDDY
ncbi:MAG: alkaline phosphatase family protein [Terriglobales bacterium]